MKRSIFLLLGVLSVSASIVPPGQAQEHARAPAPHGAVFTITNEADANRVAAFARADDGALSAPVLFATGGKGSADSLGSQGALALTRDARFLLAVNAGSNEISSFAVHGATLELRDRIASGGERPISVTEYAGRVYALNAGGRGNVTGFGLDAWGKLHATHVSRPLSMENAGAAQLQVSPDGRVLVVTEKTAQRIVTYTIDWLGRLSEAQPQTSAGSTPFGFAITQRGQLVVSEAASAALSSYAIARTGTLTTLSASVLDHQAAPCWVALSGDERFAFTANAGSSSISSYTIDRRGMLTLRAEVAGNVGAGSRPLDLALDQSGSSLYALDRGNAGVAQFSVAADGSLTFITRAGALPPFATGLAVY